MSRAISHLSIRRLCSVTTILAVFVGCAVTLCGRPASAQDAVADAARRAREQKKQQPVPAKVWTNENVPTTGPGVNVVGELPATDAATAKSSEGGSQEQSKSGNPAAPAKPLSQEEIAKKRADLQVQLEEARKDQERLEKELDLAKRDLDLQTQQASMNPMALSNDSAQAQLQPYRDTVTEKSTALDAAKAKVADLQKQLEDLDKSGTPSS